MNEKRSPAARDERTERYFEQNTPTYALERYNDVVLFLGKDASPDADLLDVGCGSGNILKMIKENTPITNLAGLDVSDAYLRQCAENARCETYRGSILDMDVAKTVGRRFHYVMLGAVLHHLVGVSRKESLGYSLLALENAWSLVKRDGALIVLEPTFKPHWLMSVLFHVKRTIARITSRRIPVFGYWNNLGEPVVSYFSHEELVQEVEKLSGAEIVENIKKVRTRPFVWRLLGIAERAESIIILRKKEGGS